MLNPHSTYRIQFHKEFTFKDFDQILPYLDQLGVSTVYASPILEASPGSMHGYDTVNPHRINPEIGTLEELRAIAEKMAGLGIRWIQDIVPNHMAFHPNNIWLMDVLEKGQESAYAGFFDINWSGDKKLPLMVPFLGSTVDEAVEKGDLKLITKDGKIKLQYFDKEWPVNASIQNVNMPVQDAIALQYYRPCHWKETNERINYRRFFTVNSLICLNIQHEETFKVYHQLIKTLLDEDVFQGLRVDHIDGLYDPETYLDRLRQLAGEDTYIVVEKILEKGEELPAVWPIQGTTGYDFLAQVNNLFTHEEARKDFTEYYEELIGDTRGVAEQVLEKKAGILSGYMVGELDNLYALFMGLHLADQEELAALKHGSLKEAIGQVLICCPVYRFYGEQLPLSGDDHKGLKKLLNEVAEQKSLKDAAALLYKVLLEQPKQGDEEYNSRATVFYLRLMQFSGPLMAKGVEDTLMYTYNRFIGHNEVGDAPDAFGEGSKTFHEQMKLRQESWPLSLNGTSTHDTKRGEDVRARLNVLTDISKEWLAKVKEWRLINSILSSGIDPNDEYFIYQTLIGSYPMPGMAEDNYPARLQAYLQKALREAKVNSDWAEPNLEYEEMIMDFIGGILDRKGDFWSSFSPFHQKVADFGILNSLSQLLLKFTCPGIPDTYQGTELWDLNLVDPDNRRPVDYQQRKAFLEEIKDHFPDGEELWEGRYNGKIKLNLLEALLSDKAVAECQNGEYIPLTIKGKHAGHLLAFARKNGKQWMITVIPLHLAGLVNEKHPDFTLLNWEETFIVLPFEGSYQLGNPLRGTMNIGNEKKLIAGSLFDHLPLAFLVIEQLDQPRAAGVLMHITSLPSPYGIGDLGIEARNFADFLSASGQKYWQLLPLNPIGADQAFSPYSSISAMAGNVLLISPDELVDAGWLKAHEVRKSYLPVKDRLDYEKAETLKNKLFSLAYDRFMKESGDRAEDFSRFCVKEADWLDDFALFVVLKGEQGGDPWYNWDLPYRNRELQALQEFAVLHKDELRFVKWKQFIFFKQWAKLRNYAAAQEIRFYGDLPFYISYDSADVWSNRDLFSLDAEGRLTGVAGVPPDYFSAEGQLWGMPVYCWDKLKEEGYAWWLNRIRKNMEMYDLLRLDHFRAFADYWEVPAGEKTAVNGTWKDGPGADFFKTLQEEFPGLPFIAEDLGKISEAVYQLRDQFKLAGMKVLQFAFGDDIGSSDYIPHNFKTDNFVVYTGTHDNDTSIGWYEKETKKVERKNLKAYVGKTVKKKNVHLVLARLAYASVARIVILPIQDVLGLGGQARMNEPGSSKGNWTWRMKEQPGKSIEKELRAMVKLYGRI
ncbi:malto-oligosyltrehalose synthase [Pedobacter sp. L105]|uniref:malto-oligosyltrehalose synthase n=1 Tax=Pedobacter sp. L105 TaxID=1641871 RepID=UPI00131AA153|nr:malto-oligosyltrehalose synthase [Pedobacter sp. L105]